MAEIAPPPVIPGQTFVPPNAPPNLMEIDGAVAQIPAPVQPAIVPETGLPVEASETLYIQNLNEKVKIEQMKSTLRSLFKGYGKILDVVAHGNLRMRGQAFVSFESKEVAAKALKEVKNFPLYAKPMQISFAKSRSDAVVKELDPEHFEQHHSTRVAAKRRKRWDNPHQRKRKAKRAAAADATNSAAAATAPRRPVVQMPDEYLPPNKILFLQNLPTDVRQEQLLALFGQYPGLAEVRMIPTKKDIAFVEFIDEATSTVAKEALHNYKLDGENKIKITFARK
ncbi:U1 small nuclear ribonucleoprotein usp102 [Rhizoctonia solani]|uniref:U1 small nuclear ribonucleoprotein usp102 n=1 Tax=Rhizoctonia solani TaxID=456999 RepID=A0A0K6G702_9AGAM|nr:U1 small nuclear ribonucleoprotein usp102 [Rhizoctonia solani]